MVMIFMERYLLCFPPTVLCFFSDRLKELQEVSAARKNKSTGRRRRGVGVAGDGGGGGLL